MRALVRNYWREESGASAVEYALVVALIAVAILATLATIGLNLVATMQDVVDAIAVAGA